MRIRTYEPDDLEALVAMYHQGNCEFRFPDLGSPLFPAKLVLEEGGRIRMALCARLTTEMFYLRQPNAGNAPQRWEWFRALHRSMELELWERGLEDAHAFLPPEVARAFGRRLEMLGWVKDTLWPCYSKRVIGPCASDMAMPTVKVEEEATHGSR